MSYISTSSDPILGAPAYFWPFGIQSSQLLETQGGTNGDPKNPGAGVLSAVMFYLPFGIKVTRYRFQVDASTSGNGFYAGMYDASGNLLFDIGRVAIASSGQYGQGAANDPGAPYLFDGSQNTITSIILPKGIYYYGWGGDGAGANTFPMIGLDALYNETIGVDDPGTGQGRRWGHNASARITGNHLPATLGDISGTGSLQHPSNICFIA